MRHLLAQGIAYVFIEAAQDFGAAVVEGGIDAEAVEDAGKLYCDITATDDDCGLWKCVEVEGFIGT